MRRWLILAALILIALPTRLSPQTANCSNTSLGAGITCITSLRAVSTDDFNVSTPAITSSGNLEVITALDWATNHCDMTDNRNPSPTLISTQQDQVNTTRVRMWWVENPNVGPNHQISCNRAFVAGETSFATVTVTFYQVPVGFRLTASSGAAVPRGVFSVTPGPVLPTAGPALIVGVCGQLSETEGSMTNFTSVHPGVIANPGRPTARVGYNAQTTAAAFTSTCTSATPFGLSMIVAAFNALPVVPPGGQGRLIGGGIL